MNNPFDRLSPMGTRFVTGIVYWFSVAVFIHFYADGGINRLDEQRTAAVLVIAGCIATAWTALHRAAEEAARSEKFGLMWHEKANGVPIAQPQQQYNTWREVTPKDGQAFAYEKAKGDEEEIRQAMPRMDAEAAAAAAREVRRKGGNMKLVLDLLNTKKKASRRQSNGKAA